MADPSRQSSGTLRAIEHRGRNVLFGAAALVVVIAGLRAGQTIIVPVLLASFVAILCIPIMNWLTRHRVPRGVAVVLVISAVVLLLIGLGLVITSAVNDFAERVPFYQSRFKVLRTGLQDWLRSAGISANVEELRAANPGAVMNLVSYLLTGLASAVTSALLVLFIIVFILIEAGGLRHKITHALATRVDANDATTTVRIAQLREVVRNVQRYLAWKTLISLGTAVAVGLSCWGVGLDFPFLWALVAFLLNYVPNIGSLIAAIPPVLLAIVQLGMGNALILTGAYIVINVVFGNLLEPMVMGHQLGLSALVVFLSLLVWGFIWGAVGALLSVPLTVILRIGLESSPRTRWLAILMAPTPPKSESS